VCSSDLYPLSPNGKTNLGLGRPFFREDNP
jgi:hypothetical protein